MLAACALALAVHAAHAAPPWIDEDLALLQQRDRQLFAVGWRLVRGNAAFCADAAPALGVMIQDAGAYDDPADIRRQLRLSGDISVEAVGPDSPAAEAGLAVNQTIVSLDGVSLADAFPPRSKRWQRLPEVVAALARAAASGPVTLGLVDGDGRPHSITLSGRLACPTRFEVLSHGADAKAEGERVIFGEDFAAFAYPEDELAAAVAHELAHNLLGHRKLLDRVGRSLARVRLTEREADRMMPWLLANAGYDPAAAVRFMQRWGPGHDGGLFRNRNHDGWDERAALIEAEVNKVQALMASEGNADWSGRFVREDVAGGKL